MMMMMMNVETQLTT